MKSIPAIPTIYRGVRYRSRLEAKWAAFFDLIGWPFTYEPFDAAGYIPDFVIHGAQPLIVEVKPASVDEHFLDAIPKITEGLRGHWDHSVLIAGVTPAYFNGQAVSAGWYTPCIGWKFAPDAWWDDDGRGICGLRADGAAPRSWIDRQWAAASNEVQWKGRTA